MCLGFRGAGADSGPADQVVEILGSNGVKCLCGGWQAETQNVSQKRAAYLQSRFNLEGVIQRRIVNQTLPADSGTGFFEINSHHDIQLL